MMQQDGAVRRICTAMQCTSDFSLECGVLTKQLGGDVFDTTIDLVVKSTDHDKVNRVV